jgi:hypothetical protein
VGIRIAALIAVIVGATGVGACTPSTIPPEALQLSPTAMHDRQMQTRRFGTKDEEKLERASAQVLQDLGFQIDESETKLGIIVASKSRDATETGQVVGAVLLAIVARGATMPIDKLQRIRASLVVKQVDNGADTTVRVTLQRTVWDNHNNISKNEPINDPKIYQEFFDKLGQSVFLTAQEI